MSEQDTRSKTCVVFQDGAISFGTVDTTGKFADAGIPIPRELRGMVKALTEINRENKNTRVLQQKTDKAEAKKIRANRLRARMLADKDRLEKLAADLAALGVELETTEAENVEDSESAPAAS